jgi:hypothetical protein
VKLKRIVEQQEMAAQYYDLGKDYSLFSRTMNSTTEEVKNRFEQAINSKLKGKKIRARASRGYKQFEKDYDIDVVNVSIDDYYDNYVVVARGKNGKDYFLKPGFKVQIIGIIEPDEQPEKPEQPEQPEQPQPAPQPVPPPQPTQTPQPQPQMKETISDTRLVYKYPVEQIEKDIAAWLPQLLAVKGDVKKYIPRDGITRKSGNKKITVYGLTIPVEDSPGLDADQIKQTLSSISKITGDITTIYTLDKFDVRGSKYMLVIKRITNY